MQSKMMQAAMNAPIARPGTNPAANDFPLKFESVPVPLGSPKPGCTLAAADLVAVLGVCEPGEVEEEVDFGLDSETGVGALRATHWLLLHVYPMGQQAPPQVFSCWGGLTWSWVFVVFCALSAHETGLMVAQFWPSGQKIVACTAALVLIARHVVPEEQQKSEGNAPPQGVSALSPPQVAVSLVSSRLPPASGSKSSGTHITRADEGKRRIESARAPRLVVGSIV